MSEEFHKPPGYEHSVAVGYEESDVRVGFIAWSGVAIVVFIVVTILAVQVYFDSLNNQQEFVKLLEPVSEDYRNLRAREDAELYSYKYTDRQKGIVRLPIQRAMDLVVSEAQAGKPFYSSAPQRVKESYSLVPDPDVMGGVHDPASKALLATTP
jgi:hypothetical protein